MFLAITDELVRENKQGYLDADNIKRIHSIMEEFEDKYGDMRGKKGKLLVKREYVKNRIKF